MDQSSNTLEIVPETDPAGIINDSSKYSETQSAVPVEFHSRVHTAAEPTQEDTTAALLKEEIRQLKFQIRKERAIEQHQRFISAEQPKLPRIHLGSETLNENIQDFVAKKKEIFLLQYSLHIKRNEIERMEQEIRDEELRIAKEERAMEDSANEYDKFLTDNDKATVEVLKKAESETKQRLDKTQELKRLSQQVINLKNDLSRGEDNLIELGTFRDFILKLTPVEWLREMNALLVTIQINNNTPLDQSVNMNETVDLSKIINEPAELFFKDPAQLLVIFKTLEDGTLALIQSCQEAEEIIDELKTELVKTDKQSKEEVVSYQKQVETIVSQIKAEQEKAEHLKHTIGQFSFVGDNGNIGTDSVLSNLRAIIRDAYKSSVGAADSSLSTLSMLAAIESKLEKLFETIEALPLTKVEQSIKARDKERRQKIREEKVMAQKQMQEDRARKALERAQNGNANAEKKPLDRKELFKPRLFKKKEKAVENQQVQEEDELMKYLSG